MTNEQILAMAEEVGAAVNVIALGRSDGVLFTEHELTHFAELVAAAEREECAKVCQGVVDGGMYDGWQQYAAAACRDAIRAMNEKGTTE